MGEVRKLQKKLRQIENLEIKISLTPEETFKVQKHVLSYLTVCNPGHFGKSRLDFSGSYDNRSLPHFRVYSDIDGILDGFSIDIRANNHPH